MERSMRPNTLAEAADRIRAGESSDFVLAEFVDTFALAKDDHARFGAIAEEPLRIGDPRLDALVGAIAEYLAKQHFLNSVPSWVGARWRYLDEPWFTTSSDSPAMQEYLAFASPAEFRSRNIFTDARPLSRARSHLPFVDRAGTMAHPV
jgi:hypothetical protein